MTHLSTTASYRIGPMPRSAASASQSRRPLLISAAALGAVVSGLLVALVVVLNQGVARGQQIRASMSAPNSNEPTRLAHSKGRVAQPVQLLATGGVR